MFTKNRPFLKEMFQTGYFLSYFLYQNIIKAFKVVFMVKLKTIFEHSVKRIS